MTCLKKPDGAWRRLYSLRRIQFEDAPQVVADSLRRSQTDRLLRLREPRSHQKQPTAHLRAFVAERSDDLQPFQSHFSCVKRGEGAESFEFLENGGQEPALDALTRSNRIEPLSRREERLARTRRWIPA